MDMSGQAADVLATHLLCERLCSAQRRMRGRSFDRPKMAPIFRKDVNDTLEMYTPIDCRHHQLVTKQIPSIRHGRSLSSLHQNLTGRPAMWISAAATPSWSASPLLKTRLTFLEGTGWPSTVTL